MSAEPTPLEISYEAIEQAQMPLSQYMARSDTLDAASDALRVAAPLIVAADIDSDTGLQVLREMAARVEAGSLDSMAFVGAVLRYADDRAARAAELRGDRKAGVE